jgi:hypothetical protein
MQLETEKGPCTVCSDPQEVLNKETGELKTVACRVCDQCIAVRRHGWVARAMAEKAMWKHTLCLALTYNDDTQENRDAAAMFAYSDVRAFLNRVRSACRDEAKRQNWKGPLPQVKFLAAGEQGSRHGRCHWHLIIYADMDLRRLGEVRGRFGVITDPEKMMTVGKRKRRLHWSLWATDDRPKGFVTFQHPDQRGMNYVLSYCLKDQFTEEKAAGTRRHAKAENFATGLFRMSKRPAIGESWIIQKMETLLAANSVLPSLQITIPGFRGFWFPTGTARKRLLWHIKAVANLVTWRTGQLPPQWAGLRSRLQDNPSDMEILLGQETEEDPEDAETIQTTLRRKQIDRELRLRDAREGFKRDWIVICQTCIRYPSKSWVWKGFGTTQYHQSRGGGYYSYISHTGVENLWQEQIEAHLGGPGRCETCWNEKRLIAIFNEGQREARGKASSSSFEMPARRQP